MTEGMKKIRWTLSIGLVGAKRQGEFEIEDDASEDDIWEAAEDDARRVMDVSWEVVE